MPETTAQDPIACTCPSCGKQFAVLPDNLGLKVECPICAAVVIAGVQEQSPESKNTARPLHKSSAVQPKKKQDKRNITYRPIPPQKKTVPTTKIRKFREETAPSDIEVAGETGIAPEKPEYELPPMEAARMEKKPTWHIWLTIFGFALLCSGLFLYYSANNQTHQSGVTMLNLSAEFIDPEADFSSDANINLMRSMKDSADRYRLQENTLQHNKEIVSTKAAHITDASLVLAAYRMATSNEERLKYVINPDDIRSKMDIWNTYIEPPTALPAEVKNSYLDGDILLLAIKMEDNNITAAGFLKQKDSGKWLLDWEAMVGYSPVLPTELIKTQPATPTLVRVRVYMNGIYDAPFTAEASPNSYGGKAYFSYTLEFPGGESVTAYADKDTAHGQEITKKLQNGHFNAMLRIHYPADIPGNKAVIIDELVRHGWLSDSTYSPSK